MASRARKPAASSTARRSALSAVSEPSVPTRIDRNTSQASFVIAITIPASTKTTIATCIHIQWRGTVMKLS